MQKRIFKTRDCSGVRVQELMTEIFPLVQTSLTPENDLEIYVNREEYTYMLKELDDLEGWFRRLPDDFEIEECDLLHQPIMYWITTRYERLYDVLVNAILMDDIKIIKKI